MRQFLLALGLIALPVALFAGIYRFQNPAVAVASVPGLGDLSALATIATDTQGLVAKGDLAAAKARITDFETAWDDAESTMRPLNPEYWGNLDDAADGAIGALRAGTPDAVKAGTAVATLLAALADPSLGSAGGGGPVVVSGIAISDNNGHALPCEDMLASLRAALDAAGPEGAGRAKAVELQAKATERCNADDDRHADEFSAEALAALK